MNTRILNYIKNNKKNVLIGLLVLTLIGAYGESKENEGKETAKKEVEVVEKVKEETVVEEVKEVKEVKEETVVEEVKEEVKEEKPKYDKQLFFDTLAEIEEAGNYMCQGNGEEFYGSNCQMFIDTFKENKIDYKFLKTENDYIYFAGINTDGIQSTISVDTKNKLVAMAGLDVVVVVGSLNLVQE